MRTFTGPRDFAKIYVQTVSVLIFMEIFVNRGGGVFSQMFEEKKNQREKSIECVSASSQTFSTSENL